MIMCMRKEWLITCFWTEPLHVNRVGLSARHNTGGQARHNNGGQALNCSQRIATEALWAKFNLTQKADFSYTVYKKHISQFQYGFYAPLGLS